MNGWQQVAGSENGQATYQFNHRGWVEGDDPGLLGWRRRLGLGNRSVTLVRNGNKEKIYDARTGELLVLNGQRVVKDEQGNYRYASGEKGGQIAVSAEAMKRYIKDAEENPEMLAAARQQRRLAEQLEAAKGR